MFVPWTKDERHKLLEVLAASRRKYNEAMDRSAQFPAGSLSETQAIADASKHLATMERTEMEYFERLPRPVVSCCPFCNRPLLRTLDQFGVDGLWWRVDASPEETPPCPHFLVLLGAVAFSGVPRGGAFEAYCGPAVPYVVPRLLRNPTVVAVVAQVTILGYTAYTIAYFVEERLAPRDLTAGWARSNYVYTAQLGESSWRIANDEWDFDLRPWLFSGKMRWCPQKGDNSTLSTDSPEHCPYLDLPGERQRLVVFVNQLVRRGLPDGRAINICP